MVDTFLVPWLAQADSMTDASANKNSSGEWRVDVFMQPP
jgi:hypothetical protein